MMDSLVEGLRRILSHPTLNGLGFLVGVVAVLFAWYTWNESKSEPLLLAQVPAVRTIVVSPERVEHIQVSANGKLVKGPISAVQVAVWNSGKRPIRQEDVLRPITIALDGEASIITARAVRVTRDAIDFKLDEQKKDSGELGLRFRILEQGDGALLQIIYAGDVGVGLKGSGVIVGQRSFSVETIQSPEKRGDKRTSKMPMDNAAGGWVAIVIGVLFTLMHVRPVLKWIRRVHEEVLGKPFSFVQLAGTTFGLALELAFFVLGLVVIYFGITILLKPTPPFPF